MAHWLRAMTAFPEDLGLSPSTYSSQLSVTPLLKNFVPSFGFLRYQLHKCCTGVDGSKISIQIVFFKKLKSTLEYSSSLVMMYRMLIVLPQKHLKGLSYSGESFKSLPSIFYL